MDRGAGTDGWLRGKGCQQQDNTDYPWLDGRAVRVPCEYSFPNLDDGSRTIIRLIRLLRAASESYVRQEPG